LELFFTTIIIRENAFFFFSARAEKGIVWTSFDSGKLANQMARFVAIVVKKPLYHQKNSCVSAMSISRERENSGYKHNKQVSHGILLDVS